MFDLKACVVCLSTNVQLYSMKAQQIRAYYDLISGVQSSKFSGLPECLCYQCIGFVKRFKQFREKCQRSHFLLQELLQNTDEIKISHLQHLNRQTVNIQPFLSYIDVSKHRYEEAKFVLKNFNRRGTKNDGIPTIQCSIPLVLEIDPANIKTDNDSQGLQTFINESDSDTEAPGIEISVDVQKFENDVEQQPTETRLNSTGEEYANLIPISSAEAKAVVEVYKLPNGGAYTCEICTRPFLSEKRLESHLRMHDKHVSGSFHCELCDFYYKTQFLLDTHMTEKHSYKYICKKCPEVSFDRATAKQHYICAHLEKLSKKSDEWYDSRPAWLNTKGGKRSRLKGQPKAEPIPSKKKKIAKMPSDFLTLTVMTQEEQYALVRDRQNCRNYKESKYKCQFCFKGYRLISTYNSHMKKHDPESAGPFKCDMCQMQFRNQRLIYKHMNITHLFKYACQMCNYVCFNRAQASSHYKWHNNVKYECPHCDQQFHKQSTRLTHIRIKHPSMHICNICGHSFVSLSGLHCHKRLSHTEQERAQSESLAVDTTDPYYCKDCVMQFVDATAFNTHLGSSYKHAATNQSIKSAVSLARRSESATNRTRGRPATLGRRPRVTTSEIVNTGTSTVTNCEVCNEVLANDVQAKKHYEAEHPGTDFLKRYMCDVCGHTTKQYANLLVHMRTHTNEKPYGCHMCERRFSMPSNRDRHMVVHTGEKRYECQHCGRRFTQSSAVKLHIQTVHLKIPYAPWDKKNRKRRKELEGAGNFAGTEQVVEVDEQAQRKMLFEPQGDYLNAYINYNDE